MSHIGAMRRVLLVAAIALTSIIAVTPKFAVVFNEDSQLPELRSLRGSHRIDEHAVLRAFRGKRLVMMGDSLTRYQYLNLVHLLEHGVWPDKESELCNANRLRPWPNYFEVTNAAFRGREICDCYRGSACCFEYEVFENRRYYNPELQTMVWYVQWFGDKSFPHGHIRWMDRNSSHYETDSHRLPCMPTACNSTHDAWKMSPAEFMETFITHHQPDAFVLNSGHHTLYDARSARTSAVPRQLREALQRVRRSQADAQTRIVWKTTTPALVDDTLQFPNDTIARELDAEQLLELFDTAAVVQPLYDVFAQRVATQGGFSWDRLHFQCWVHTELNIAMTRQLFGPAIPRRHRRRRRQQGSDGDVGSS